MLFHSHKGRHVGGVIGESSDPLFLLSPTNSSARSALMLNKVTRANNYKNCPAYGVSDQGGTFYYFQLCNIFSPSTLFHKNVSGALSGRKWGGMFGDPSISPILFVKVCLKFLCRKGSWVLQKANMQNPKLKCKRRQWTKHQIWVYIKFPISEDSWF